VEAERGQSRRLTCPYHAWTYKSDGSLMAMPQPDAFSGVCRQDRGLKPIPTQERYGTVWITPQPGQTGMELTAHLGSFADELAQWLIGDWHYTETRVHHIAANWKLTMDTFTEGYHIPMLHRDSLATIADGAANYRTQYGDHHRQAVPMKSLRELRDVPAEQWNAFQRQLHHRR
jgi:phenylpropionate dioxygenase-like ring-hydroxylating dioxygenase large terminal subunit